MPKASKIRLKTRSKRALVQKWKIVVFACIYNVLERSVPSKNERFWSYFQVRLQMFPRRGSGMGLVSYFDDFERI